MLRGSLLMLQPGSTALSGVTTRIRSRTSTRKTKTRKTWTRVTTVGKTLKRGRPRMREE